MVMKALARLDDAGCRPAGSCNLALNTCVRSAATGRARRLACRRLASKRQGVYGDQVDRDLYRDQESKRAAGIVSSSARICGVHFSEGGNEINLVIRFAKHFKALTLQIVAVNEFLRIT